MDFAWVSLQTTHDDGRMEEELWRAPETKPDLARIITMTIPLPNGTDHGASGGGDARFVGRPTLDGTSRATLSSRTPIRDANAGRFLSRRFEIAICANGSVESAARRATLFGRLLDENGQRVPAGRTRL